MIWKLVDQDTGTANHAIDWSFRVGDRVNVRLVNTMDSDHPMHHPFHIHGAGRFLVIARDDVPEPNLVWKDPSWYARARRWTSSSTSRPPACSVKLRKRSPSIWDAHAA
jgi:FtsP/CotA-like multicopper oxidase with cupredoxin domain